MKKIIICIIVVCIGFVSNAQKIGEYAPEISLPNTSDSIIKLSSLKGKVVILDFWASWCGPCIAANKKMAKLYKKYKKSGLEIYGLSIDANKDNWIAAIKKQKLKWIQVNDPGNWQSKTARAWNIEAVPTTFLIDKHGIIVAIDADGKELEQQIKKLIAE
jgi:peroxiredoxin